MKYKRTTLLAGIAALALLAWNGLASAQDSSKSESSQGTAPHSTQQINRRRDERPIEPGRADPRARLYVQARPTRRG